MEINELLTKCNMEVSMGIASSVIAAYKVLCDMKDITPEQYYLKSFLKSILDENIGI